MPLQKYSVVFYRIKCIIVFIMCIVLSFMTNLLSVRKVYQIVPNVIQCMIGNRKVLNLFHDYWVTLK